MSHQQTSSTVLSTTSTGVKMKTILLIGASKHIGFHILEDIAPNKDNYSLHVLARTQSSSIPNFKGKENITFIQGDAKDPTTIQNTIASIPKLDYIIITVGTSSSNPSNN
jgi:nucleoside-diphosphate-sugar epimerase